MPTSPLRRLGAASLLALAVLPAAGAHAAQVERVDHPQLGPILVYQADPGVADKVQVFHSGGKVTFSTIAGGGPLTTSSCTLPAGRPWEAECSDAGIVAVIVNAEDGDDEVNAFNNPALGVPVVISGGPGNDVLTGGGADDLLGGEDGDDTLNDSPGADQMDGGAGNDRFWSAIEGAGDEVLGGSGTDQASFKRGRPFTVSLDGQANDGVPGENDNYRAVEDLGVEDGGATFVGDDGPNTLSSVLGGGDNRFEGRGGDDVLHGGTGNDQLIGAGGDDKLIGEDGDDTLDGGAGKDTYIGDRQNFTYLEGVGADTILARDGIADSINCGPGADTAQVDDKDVLPTDPVTVCEAIDRQVFTAPGGTTPPPAPAPAPAPQPGPAAGGGRATPRALTATVRRSGRKVTVKGRLTVPAGASCSGGRVQVALRAGRKAAGRGTARLARDCSYKATVKATRRGRLRVSVTFLGTAALAPISRSAPVR